MTDLPNWVYDMVMALQKWNYEHPKLYYNEVRLSECGCEALAHVPEEVKAATETMRQYLSRREAE